ncbi:MAG: protein kinase [Planctomycetota bacterium]
MKICLSCEGVTNTPAQRCGNCSAPLVPTDAVHYPVRRGELDAGNPLIGTVVDGKYRLQSVLGRGGLGTVFRAQHTGSLAPVAVKLLHSRYADRPEYRRSLLPEARRAAAVVHENCARLLDVGEGDQGVAYLAMELVDGQTLDEVLLQGSVAPSNALEILIQIADALVAVHDAELVHCDLSPRNVMVAARSGHLMVKVLDFGIARGVGLASSRLESSELWGFANPMFSAPELLRGEAVDVRADVYSFGAVARLLLTGLPPIAESETERVVAAVREGELDAWPRGTGVPVALRRLVQRCMRLDREQRPASMREVHQRLLAMRTGWLPTILRSVAVLVGLAVVITLATGEEPAPVFLRPQPGAALQLIDGALGADEPAVDLRAGSLETVLCYYGGFASKRLRAEIGRDGVVLARIDLRPVVDDAIGTLVLSNAQEGWREVVAALVETSREGPVDLAFVVPGAAVLGASRLRVDEQPPTVRARLRDGGERVRADSALAIALDDDLGFGSAEIVGGIYRSAGARSEGAGRGKAGSGSGSEPATASERFRMPLPTSTRSFALGAAFTSLGIERAPHGGWLRVLARDRAGNEVASDAIDFAAIDVSVPHVTAVVGPAGERQLSRVGNRLRMRVQLSNGEAGCVLRIGRVAEGQGGVAVDVVAPIPLDLEDGATSVSHAVELPYYQVVGDDARSSETRSAGEPAAAGRADGAAQPASQAGGANLVLSLAIEDVFGNVAERQFVVGVADRSPVVTLVPRAPSEQSGPGLWSRGELIVGPLGCVADVGVSSRYRVAARVDTARNRPAGRALRVDEQDVGGGAIHIPPLPPGTHDLTVVLTDPDGREVQPIERAFRMRVLPSTIEVRRPASSARFLPALVDAGLFAFRDGLLRPGPGWRLDPALRPYVTGKAWVGAQTPTALPIRAEDGPLLPAVAPVPGRNLIRVELRDVLGRPVALVDGGDTSARLPAAGEIVGQIPGGGDDEGGTLQPVADFWWSDVAPELVGEQVLVEFGQRARVRIRMPLPLADQPLATLRLGIPSQEIQAQQVLAVPDSIRSELVFLLSYADWCAAARLTAEPRSRFAEGLERSIDAYVDSPAGRRDVTLRLRTTRSTLAPLRVEDLAGLDPDIATAFADLVLVPVLAPDDAFEEPIPKDAPPRFTFRPQHPVAVRNMSDLLLQSREFTWGQARALRRYAARMDERARRQCLHVLDARGLARFEGDALLPSAPLQLRPGEASPQAPDGAVLTGVDFFQAWTLTRVLGLAMGADPQLFRLPIGCELELAAYAGLEPTSCHGAATHGGRVQAAAFVAGTAPLPPWRSAQSVLLGDVLPSGYAGVRFEGLDFGVSEWVLDLPHIPGAEMLLREWTGDHSTHLRRVLDMGAGTADPAPDPLGLQARLGVIRGLAFGDSGGAIDASGRPLNLAGSEYLPPSVPGVLRTAQLRRDGRDLVGSGRDPRLARVGFRVAGSAIALARLWEGR